MWRCGWMITLLWFPGWRLLFTVVLHYTVSWYLPNGSTTFLQAAKYQHTDSYSTGALVMGLGHVKADIPHPAEEVDEYARFGLFMAEFLYAWSLGMSKLAILCFYWRLFSVSNIRPGIYILGACTIIWLTIRTFMTIFHCIPVQAYWNFNIKDAVCTIDPGKFMFGTTLVHLLLEISVLLLPVFQVASLRLRPGQKFAVVAMFMFGILYVLFHILLSSLLRYLCTSLANSFL